MRYEQKCALPPLFFIESFEIESRDNRLPGPSCGDDQITAATVYISLSVQRFEYPLLEGMRTQVKEERGMRSGSVTGSSYCNAERFRIVRIKRNKFSAVPVGFEFNHELPENVVHILRCDLEIPFESTRDSRMRKVCRTNISGRKSCGSPEVVSFGV